MVISLQRIRIIILLLLCIIIKQNHIYQPNMDITIDFTAQKHQKVSELADYPYLRSITFILPFFQQLKHNFAQLYDYISFLNDKPLVKIFVKPHGQEIKPKYKTVAVGGTFDHLHIGHQILLMFAALSAQKKVIIGVTSQQMLQKKANKEIIQSLLMRNNQVKEFIMTFKPQIELEFVQLFDPFGPTITESGIDALMVSPQTIKTGHQINEKRKEKGWDPLAIEVVPIMGPIRHLTSIKEIQNKISSTQIRSHLLAKNGLTIEKYTQYQQIWLNLIDRIDKALGLQQKENHLIGRKWWDIVVKYYSQYWRYYHTNHHIAVMFKELSETKEMGYDQLSQIDKIVLEISIFFHDIIYRPDLKTNEADSANFAEAFINQIWKNNDATKKQVASKVKAAILVTQQHKPTTAVQRILCDLDMSILDSPLQKYKIFAFNVQRQYSPLYKQNYPSKRIQFLKKVEGSYKFSWRKGDNMQQNIKWEIEHWGQQKNQ